jgi:hypothetical protein
VSDSVQLHSTRVSGAGAGAGAGADAGAAPRAAARKEKWLLAVNRLILMRRVLTGVNVLLTFVFASVFALKI